MDRRRFLQALASLGMLAVSPARAQFNPKPRFAANPFALGVASGYPQPTGFSLGCKTLAFQSRELARARE